MGDVAGDTVGRLGVQQVGELRHQPVARQALEDALQPTGQKRLVEPRTGRLFHSPRSGPALFDSPTCSELDVYISGM